MTPAWVQPASWAIHLGTGVLVAAFIAIFGLWMRHNPVATVYTPNHLFDYGLWFCAYGVFGNGCFVNP